MSSTINLMFKTACAFIVYVDPLTTSTLAELLEQKSFLPLKTLACELRITLFKYLAAEHILSSLSIEMFMNIMLSHMQAGFFNLPVVPLFDVLYTGIGFPGYKVPSLFF